MITRKFIIGGVAFLLLFSCRNGNPTVTGNNIKAQVTDNSQNKLSNNNIIQDKKLLLGKWISADDASLSVYFTDNYYIEYDNGNIADSSKYIFSNVSCEKTTSNLENNTKFLSVLAKDGSIDFCYSVTALDSVNLSLMYLNGNGTVSSYVRQK